jgi:hypothetical protein
MRSRAWIGRPAEAAKLQEMLSAMSSFKIGQLHDYVLNIKAAGKKVVGVMWAADMETEDLRETRTLLERAGHLPYAEALAYRQNAQVLAGHRLFEPALPLIRTALQVLGPSYWSDGLLDDSDASLALASHLQGSGQPEDAWTVYRTVADSRLSAYQRLFHVVEKHSP